MGLMETRGIPVVYPWYGFTIYTMFITFIKIVFTYLRYNISLQ